MNMLIKQAHLLLLPVVLCCNIIGAITINNKDINKTLKPGEVLTYTANAGIDNVAFNVGDDNFSIGSVEVYNAQDVFNRFVAFSNERHGVMQTKRLTMDGSSQFFNGQHISSDEELVIDVYGNFLIDEVMLKSKKVILITDSIQCGNCFVDSDELIIKTRSAAALCAIIRFSRDENSKNPMVLSGIMNFATNNSNGAVSVLGAKDMAIVFSPDAFK